MQRKPIIYIALLIMCLACSPSYSIARTFRIDHVIYKQISDTEIEVSNGQYALGDVVIPQTVNIKGKEYKVTQIKSHAFKNNFNLRSLVIPNSVTKIGKCAFWNCTHLKEVTVPDFVVLENVQSCIFSGCNKLETVKGYQFNQPKWVSEHIEAYGNKKLVDKVIKTTGRSFAFYAEHRIFELMDIWQQKKEYETTAQWQQRVTDDGRKKQQRIVEQQVVDEYVAMYGLNNVKGIIGYYDADYGVYPITVANDLGTFYLQVSIEDAPKVKSDWEKVTIDPAYGIVDGDLTIIGAECHLNGKTYKTVEVHDRHALGTNVELPPLQFDLPDNDIDKDIPLTKDKNDMTFAVIIGNESYKEVSKVPYALNDAQIFASYCKRTLGLPQKNIKIYKDATYGTMLSAIENIQEIAKAYSGKISVIFYYAGHGIPDETSREAFLLPVDANGRNMAACYPIRQLYRELENLNAKQVVVFLDACFSGAQRGNGMLALARGVAIAAKEEMPQGNMVVFSAASADETAYPYQEKEHGLFTYYLLKKLNETKGDVTLGELESYICEKVAQESVVTNGKSQTPTVIPSVDVNDNWRNLKLVK